MVTSATEFDLGNFDYTIDRSYCPIKTPKKGQNETTLNTLLTNKATLLAARIPLPQLQRIELLCQELLKNMHAIQKENSSFLWGKPKIRGMAEISDLSAHLSVKVIQVEQEEVKSIDALYHKLEKQLSCLDLRLLLETLHSTNKQVLEDEKVKKAKQFCIHQAYFLLESDYVNHKSTVELLLQVDPSLTWLKDLLGRKPSDAILGRVVEALRSMPKREEPSNFHLLEKALSWIKDDSPTPLPLYQSLLSAFGVLDLSKDLTGHMKSKDILAKLAPALWPGSTGKEAPKKEIQCLPIIFKYLTEIASYRQHPETAEILQQGVELLWNHYPQFDWLTALVSLQNCPPTLTMRFVTTMQTVFATPTPMLFKNQLYKIFLRYSQIMQSPLTMRPQECLKIAQFIEVEALLTMYYDNQYFDKDEHNLPRSIHYEVDKKIFSILLKRKPKGNPPFFCVRGGYKKVCGTISLEYDVKTTPSTPVQAINTYNRKKKNPGDPAEKIPAGDYDLDPSKFNYDEELKKLLDEANLHMHLTKLKLRGIWPLSSYAVYDKQLILKDGSKIKVPMLSSILKRGTGNLFEVLCAAQSMQPSPELLFSVFEELTWAILELHSRGYIHGDIKTTNGVILIEDAPHGPKDTQKVSSKGKADTANLREIIVDGKRLEVGFIDWGMTFLFNGPNPPVKLFSQGLYGSRECTAPELLGKPNYPLGELFKVEMFALGYLFYTLLKKQSPPWGAKILSFVDNGQVIPPNVLQNIKEDIFKLVEQPAALLFRRKNSLTLIEELELFAYDMLRLNPRDRLGAEQAIARINEIRKKHYG